jgi:hypothetical protein
MADILITIDKFIPEVFSFILQQGVIMKFRAGKSVRDVLCTQLGLSADYVENRISTIFLDGQPVDDIDSSHVKDKATLSLSAAMPGLLGATMRRKGFYASFRNTITYKDDNDIRENPDGMLRIKLFNIIIREIGADLLHEGVYVSYDDIKLLLTNKDFNFMQNCVSILMDGKKINRGNLFKSRLSASDQVCVKMIS